MNERLTQFALAGLALLMAWYLLGPGAGTPPPQSRPHSEDRGERGLRVLSEWLEHRGLEVLSWRRRYTELEAADNGDLLISHYPHSQGVTHIESRALRNWVANGGHLLLVASPSAMRPTALGPASPLAELLSGFGWQQLGVTTLSNANFASGETPIRLVLEPAQDHPLLASIERLVGEMPANWSASPKSWPEPTLEGALIPPLMHWRGPERPGAFWYTPHGEGRVWLLLSGELLGNAHIARADNALLVESLARWAGGRVLLDDFHHGLSEVYDPGAFYADPRLRQSLLWMLALWALVMLGGWARMLPSPRPPARHTSVPLADGVSQLLARRLSPADSAELLLGHRLRQWLGSPRADEAAWQKLRSDPVRDPALVDELAALYAARARIGERGLQRFAQLLAQLNPQPLLPPDSAEPTTDD